MARMPRSALTALAAAVLVIVPAAAVGAAKADPEVTLTPPAGHQPESTESPEPSDATATPKSESTPDPDRRRGGRSESRPDPGPRAHHWRWCEEGEQSEPRTPDAQRRLPWTQRAPHARPDRGRPGATPSTTSRPESWKKVRPAPDGPGATTERPQSDTPRARTWPTCWPKPDPERLDELRERWMDWRRTWEQLRRQRAETMTDEQRQELRETWDRWRRQWKDADRGPGDRRLRDGDVRPERSGARERA